MTRFLVLLDPSASVERIF